MEAGGEPDLKCQGASLRARLQIASFKGRGLPPAAYQPLHAAFASGLLPVVAGSRAIDALYAYAQVATAGRSVTVQATTSVADVQDLFGRVAERRFIPHPAGLIDIVRAARKSEGLFLVILDGINRGATESFLLPLMRAAVTAQPDRCTFPSFRRSRRAIRTARGKGSTGRATSSWPQRWWRGRRLCPSRPMSGAIAC